jgi:hypothetical protein
MMVKKAYARAGVDVDLANKLKRQIQSRFTRNLLQWHACVACFSLTQPQKTLLFIPPFGKRQTFRERSLLPSDHSSGMPDGA